MKMKHKGDSYRLMYLGNEKIRGSIMTNNSITMMLSARVIHNHYHKNKTDN